MPVPEKQSSPATADACEDCLSPPEVMRAILGKTLAVPAETIDLHYPGLGS
jgi:hypothetical protein